MNKLQVRLATIAITSAFVVAAPAFANHPGPGADANLGTPIHEGRISYNASPDRIIVIDGSSKWVNVTGGKTVRFVAGDQSFDWLFDTFLSSPVFDLREIAPAGMIDRSVTVYVSPDPLYTS
jgi:hypothetical protein